MNLTQPTQPNVKRWMRRNATDYRVQGSPWEINTTALAEAAAQEFDHDHWLDDETHWVWDLACEVGEAIERERTS